MFKASKFVFLPNYKILKILQIANAKSELNYDLSLGHYRRVLEFILMKDRLGHVIYVGKAKI